MWTDKKETCNNFIAADGEKKRNCPLGVYIYLILKLSELIFYFKCIQLSKTVELYVWKNLKHFEIQKNEKRASSCFSSQIQQKMLHIYNDVMLQLDCRVYQTRLDKANFKNAILIKLVPWCRSLMVFWPCSWLFNTKRYF